ncbi:MAG: hypothetical protein K2I71_01750 [Helicobacter sp.]|nr:hypothetical protein [Helicobacter sp.]
MKKAALAFALTQTLFPSLDGYGRSNSTKSNPTKGATSTIFKKERKKRTKHSKAIKKQKIKARDKR